MLLLSPFAINGMILPNRVVVPAVVTDRYLRYAEGHVGLIVVEATSIHGGKSGPLLRLSDASFIPGHRDLARRVHDCSPAKIVPQIIHFMKVARSGWRQTIDSLAAADIELIIAQFAA